MKLGNIVSDSELINHEKVDYLNYLRYEELDILDKNLPTLFIGWFNVFDLFKSKRELNILEKEIIKNKFIWEFSFDEKKSDHIDGVFNFNRNAIKYYCSTYKFEMIDPFFFNIKTMEELKSYIPKDYSKVYDGEDKLYFLSNKKIVGIDKIVYNKCLDFTEEFFSSLYNSNVKIIEDKLSKKINVLETKFPYYPYIKPHSVVLL